MDMDFEEESVSSEDEDNALGMRPWQCGLSNVSERVLALNQNGSFIDITLTFPDSEITYDVHRLILAMSSPVFAGILYGPTRTEGPNVLLHGDNAEEMAFVIAHCYGYDLELPDIDMHTALEIYKLADKYILHSLKEDCSEHIITLIHMSPDDTNDVIEFVERYNFTDLKSNCLSLIKDLFKEALDKYNDNECYEDEPDNISAFGMLMSISDAWIEDLISGVDLKVLEFKESWKYPESPLEDNRLRTILSSKTCSLDKFYGCIDADLIYQFPLVHNQDPVHDPGTKESLKLCLSVTDLHHAKRVIDTINEQNRFKSNVIVIHIRCEEVWPSDWSPIRPERTHRPSLLVISDTDDNKTSWVVEAAKALLPQCEGSGIKLFMRKKFYEDVCEVKLINVLFLPRSNFTPNGFINLLQELFRSGVKGSLIILHSPHISDVHKERINGSIRTLVHSGFCVIIAHECDIDYLFRSIYKSILPKHVFDSING